jgi:phage terminase small subunit
MHNSKPPALRPQHNGWTPERQQRFLDHLAANGSVSGAARAAGMSRQSAYWLRRQLHSQEFARAWDDALAETDRWIEDMAMDRLLEGEEEVIERDGQTVAVRRRPADVRLLLFHLNRLQRREDRREDRLAKVPVPVDSSKVAELRAELRRLAAENAEEAEERHQW